MISVILTPLLIALIAILPLIVMSEPIKTYRKLKTPPCRTCARKMSYGFCRAKEYCDFHERIDPFDWGDDAPRELIRGTRWCHYEPKE